MEISKLSDKEFKVMIIKMLNELGRRLDEHTENFNRIRKYEENLNRAEEYKKIKIKNKQNLKAINCRLGDTEKWNN